METISWAADHHASLGKGVAEGLEMTQAIFKIEVSGAEIQNLILNTLAPAVEGKPVTHAILAMLTFSVMLMKPYIDVKELQECVMGASSYIVTHLAEKDKVVGGIN